MGRYGVGRSAFARMVGTTVATIWKWEVGSAEPSGPAKALLHYMDLNLLKIDPRKFEKRRGRKPKIRTQGRGRRRGHLGARRGGRLGFAGIR
jgi:hypothetical protein